MKIKKFSLNDILATGPPIQDNLFDVLLRFREYPIALTADVTKMYRQIKVDSVAMLPSRQSRKSLNLIHFPCLILIKSILL